MKAKLSSSYIYLLLISYHKENIRIPPFSSDAALIILECITQYCAFICIANSILFDSDKELGSTGISS